MMVIDTETTGLTGYPVDRVLEIGICELSDGGDVVPVYNVLINYPDIRSFCERNGPIWVLENTDMTVEALEGSSVGITDAVEEVRSILDGEEATSYNVPFDFGKFLDREPWDLRSCCVVPFDIMNIATKRVHAMADADEIPDKDLQARLLRDWKSRPDKWVRSIDAYRVLCPDDPAHRDGVQSHRALDDAVQETYILKTIREGDERCSKESTFSE